MCAILLMEEIRRSPVEVGNLSHYLHGFTLPETNVAPETWWLGDYFHTFLLGWPIFRSTLSFREGIHPRWLFGISEPSAVFMFKHVWFGGGFVQLLVFLGGISHLHRVSLLGRWNQRPTFFLEMSGLPIRGW